jgi:hypothetical protein
MLQVGVPKLTVTYSLDGAVGTAIYRDWEQVELRG